MPKLCEDCLKYVFILNPKRHRKTHLYTFNIFLTFLRIQKFKCKVELKKIIECYPRILDLEKDWRLDEFKLLCGGISDQIAPVSLLTVWTLP